MWCVFGRGGRGNMIKRIREVLKKIRKRKVAKKKKKENDIINSWEQDEEKQWQTKYIKGKAYLAIGLGVLVLIIATLLSYICETSDWSETNKILCRTLVTAINSVFSIFIGIGISTLVLDFFSYIKYTRERIKEIMLDKTYIETLSTEEQKRIINICEKSLYYKHTEIPNDSLYMNIKELIVPLIRENYYKQYKVHVDCYIDEEAGVIRKKVHKILDVECLKDNSVFRMPFSTYLTKINGIENMELFKLTKCLHGREDITKKIQKHIKMQEVEFPNLEDIKFTIDYEFVLNKGLNRIETRTETIVPIDDNTYAHTITIPCKRYSANFSLHNRNYDILGFAFAFDDEQHKNDLEKVIYKDKYDDCFKIRFENWTLPGDGVVFIINKVSDKIEKQ